MNYIRHLNNAWKQLSAIEQATAHHISIYFTVFHLWNKSRFSNPLSIKREEIMWLSKVGSAATYTRCMRQLQEWGFWKYQPSYNPMVGTHLHIYTFDNAHGKGVADYTYISNINNTKQQTPTPELNEVVVFFQKEKSTADEAHKFFAYYTANGWLQGGKAPIINWQAAATAWLLKAKSFQNTLTENEKHPTKPHEPQDTNYSEPL